MKLKSTTIVSPIKMRKLPLLVSVAVLFSAGWAVYSNNNNNIRTVLLLHSKVYYDVINNKEMKFDIKDIDALSISFYDIDLLENEGDNINLF